MKSKETELNIDYIGGETPLTAEEESAISEYIKQSKSLKSKRASHLIKRNKLQKLKA